jgi:predicted ester cyclase
MRLIGRTGAGSTSNFLVAEGEMVAVHSVFRGTQRGPAGPFPASGKQLSANFISIYRVEAGRIAEGMGGVG